MKCTQSFFIWGNRNRKHSHTGRQLERGILHEIAHNMCIVNILFDEKWTEDTKSGSAMSIWSFAVHSVREKCHRNEQISVMNWSRNGHRSSFSSNTITSCNFRARRHSNRSQIVRGSFICPLSHWVNRSAVAYTYFKPCTPCVLMVNLAYVHRYSKCLPIAPNADLLRVQKEV